MRAVRALSIGLTAILVLLACGDDDGALGGVSGDKRLSDLNEQETIDVCEAARARVRTDQDAERGSCLVSASVAVSFSGVFGGDGDASQLCEETLALCLDGEELEPCEAADIPESCEASVAEYSDCVDRGVDALRELAHHTCEDVVEANEADAEFGSEVEDSLESCTELLAPCFEDNSDPDCCTPDDACGYADDGFCDCTDQSWDAADCAS